MPELMRIGPFRRLRRLEREMDRFLGGFFDEPLVRMGREENAVRVPSLDLRETDEELIVTAEMPGVSKENVELEVGPESLHLTGEIRQEREEKEPTYHRCERVYERFERTLPLATEVVTDGVKATLKEGVLEVRLPKREPTKAETPRKVRIE